MQVQYLPTHCLGPGLGASWLWALGSLQGLSHLQQGCTPFSSAPHYLSRCYWGLPGAQGWVHLGCWAPVAPPVSLSVAAVSWLAVPPGHTMATVVWEFWRVTWDSNWSPWSLTSSRPRAMGGCLSGLGLHWTLGWGALPLARVIKMLT